MGVEGAGEAFPRLIEGNAGLPAPAVQARRISEPVAEERQHGVADLGAYRGRGGVVEVDRLGHGWNIAFRGHRFSLLYPPEGGRTRPPGPPRASGRSAARRYAAGNGRRAFRRYPPFRGR